MTVNLVTAFALLAIAWGTLETGSNVLALIQGTDQPIRHISRLVWPVLWLGAGVGFYRRKEAARKLVVALLALSVVINVIITVYSTYLAYSAFRAPADWPEMEQALQPTRTAAVGAALASLIGVVICGWLFRRFQSPDIRREFA